MMNELRYRTVVIDYTNHRGERAKRPIIPLQMVWGTSTYYPTPQWLLDAWDPGKGDMRQFAMTHIHSWESSNV